MLFRLFSLVMAITPCHYAAIFAAAVDTLLSCFASADARFMLITLMLAAAIKRDDICHFR